MQAIAFLAYLLEQGESGPHVIIVPSSTIGKISSCFIGIFNANIFSFSRLVYQLSYIIEKF